MSAQTIVTPLGERLVVVPEADYMALVQAGEDAADRAAIAAFRRELAAGQEEFVPVEIVDRILAGENRIRVWREHRGMTATALARQAGIGQGFLSQIEAGKREGTVDTLRKIADALGVAIDDLVG